MEVALSLVLVFLLPAFALGLIRAFRSASAHAQRLEEEAYDAEEERRYEADRARAAIAAERAFFREQERERRREAKRAWKALEPERARESERRAAELAPVWREQHAARVARIHRQRQAAALTFGFVYLVRNGDLYKIGITRDLQRRMRQLKPDEVLNSVRCSNFKAVERQLHARFKDVRLPQSEYFRLNRAQIQQVHRLMSELADF